MAVRYVLIPKFCEMTGYSAEAIRQKIKEGVWIEGHQYKRGTDRHVFIDIEGFEKWVEGQRYVSQASRHAKAA